MVKLKIRLLAVVLTLLLGLLTQPSPHPVAATPEEFNQWSRVKIPGEGEAGNWVLAGGSNIQHLTLAADGSLYAYANPSGTSDRLFKSTDAGANWSATGLVKDVIVAIATAPDDAAILYYATLANIYKSTDAGASFTLWGQGVGGAGSNNITITTLAVARQESRYLVALGTADNDSGQFGRVYLLDEKETLAGWKNTNIGNYDIVTMNFSPRFTSDHQLVAIVTDETSTLISSRIDTGEWGRVITTANITGRAARSAVIAFPADYDATSEEPALFAGIDAGSERGDVYKVNQARKPDSSLATDLNIGARYNLSNVDISGLAVSGNTTAANLLAGAANSTQVYISSDTGLNWTRSRQKPSGQSKTEVLMAPDFTSSRRAYAATSGDESAFSSTTDGGVIWHQTGLIDTTLSSIVDLAPSPEYSQDTTLFLLTFDGGHTEHSLWRSLNSGTRWERVVTSTLTNADSINLVELSPQYASGHQTLFLAGTAGSNSVIWKSTDNGQTFNRRDAPFPIDIWTVASDDTLFLGSYNGTNGLVYSTNDGGFTYSSEAVAGSQPLKSIALSPNYAQDKTILLGNTNGWVYYSSDNGISFKPLPPDATSSPLSGAITVAFNPEFSRNNTIYAASNTANKGIYRFTINKSTKWENIDSTLPSGGIVNQLQVADYGTLYATNSKASGGLERCLNPTYSPGPTAETVTKGLDDGATLTGVWLRGNQLWSVDTHNTRLMTYTDSLTSAVVLKAPTNASGSIGTGNIILEWDPLKGATQYQWQLDNDTNFSTIPSGFEGNTQGSSVRSPALATATTYYWRVRANAPVLSPWSAKWSFTTSLGATVIAPELLSPKAGASEMPLKPVFQWSAIAGADSYELLVSTDTSLANPIIVKTGDYRLPATAWQSNINLDYDTTYFWKVRASGANNYSAWSAVGAFTTTSPSSQSSPPSTTSSSEISSSPPLTPSPALVTETQLSSPQLSSSPQQPASPPLTQSPLPTQPAFPVWFLYLVSALLLATVLLLTALLIARIRRS